MRHGEEYLMHVLVYLTPDGGQMAMDAQEGAQARLLSLKEDEPVGPAAQ